MTFVSWLAYNALLALPFVLLALLCERLLRRRPALVHVAWLLVLARLVAPPLGPLAPAPGGASGVIPSSGGPVQELVGWMTRTFGGDWSSWLGRGLVALFLVGVAGFLVHELLGFLQVRRGLRRTPEAPRALRRATESLARRLGVAVPDVRVLRGTGSPFVWSSRRGTLVLADDAAVPASTVLAHELAHLRRRDHWVAWLELLVVGLHWWNPLAWFARRRMRVAAELACDAWVVERFPEERDGYARELVDALERSLATPPVARSIPAIGWHADELEERLRHILSGDRAADRPRALTLTAAALLVVSLPGVAAPTLAGFRAALPAIPAGLDRQGWSDLLARADVALALDPGDAEAGDRRALALLGLGRHDEAVAQLERQLALGWRPDRTYYNLACAHALAGRPDTAVDALAQSVAHGMDRAFLRQDPDLAALHGRPDFEQLAGTRP